MRGLTGFTKAFLTWLGKSFSCKMGNHEYVLSIDDNGDLRMRCLHCPSKTPGWPVGKWNQEKKA